MKFSWTAFCLEQWRRLPPPLHANLAGKTVVVTGANTGIGLEASKHFARMKPARLILGCRSEPRGRVALEQIAADTGLRAELELVDLADFESVHKFARGLSGVPVDILVSNAAVATHTRILTHDKWEQQLQVNHLANALLSLLLVPNMVKAAEEHRSKARLVIVSSDVHHLLRFDKPAYMPNTLQQLNDAPNVQLRYAETKLLNVLFTRALANHLATSLPIIPTAVNPGFCYSEIHRDFSGLNKAFTKVCEVLLGRTAEQGARQLIWAALGPDGKDGEHVKHLRGAYVSTNQVCEPSDYVISKEGYEDQERVWRETIDILEKISPELNPILKDYSLE